MSSSYVPTGHWTQGKKLQYVVEASYGVVPTASPIFTSVGELENITRTTEVAMKRYRSLGSEDMYQFLKNGLLHSFEIEYQPLSSDLLKRGINAQGGGSGTIDQPLSFMESEDIDDLEHFTFYKGAKCDQVSVEVVNEAVKVNQNFICREITTPAPSHGLTTPTFAPANTDAPWTGADSGSNPFTHNSLNYDVDKFKFTVNRHLDAIRPNGETLIKFLVPTTRDVAGEFDVLRKDSILITECNSTTSLPRLASYVLKALTSTVSFIDMVLIAVATARPATATEALRDSFKFEAKSISVS